MALCKSAWALVGRCRGGGGWRVAGLRGPDLWTHKKQEVEEEDRDEDEATDEDVRTESHVGFVLREVRGRDVSVLVIMHAYQLRGDLDVVPMIF